MYKSLPFPKTRQPDDFPAMLNEQAEEGFEYVETYAANPNRPQHLSVLFKSSGPVMDPAEKVKEETTDAPPAQEEEKAPVSEAETVTTESADEPEKAEEAPKAPASKPGARRGRKPAAKKA